MRVAFVVGTFPTIVETFIVQQIESLIDAGVDVEIFPLAPDEVGSDRHQASQHLEPRIYRKQIPFPGVVRRWSRLVGGLAYLNGESRGTVRSILVSGLRSPRKWAFGSFFDLQRLLERMPFDVVHAHFGHLGLRCVDLPWIESLPPLVTTFHGWDANVAPGQLGHGCYLPLFENGKAFTVNSEFLRNRVTELGCPAKQIETLPMGVDMNTFTYSPRVLHPGEPLRLLTVGRLVAVKGHCHAIRALARLRKEGLDVEYTIVGGGELADELQMLSHELGVTDVVTFCGPQSLDEVRNSYYKAHIFVLPSVRLPRGDEETQGVVVQEAQATGMPVVVTDIGGVAEGIAVGKSGVVSKAGDPDSLADAIKTVLAREAEWPAMGSAGSKFVRSKYDSKTLCGRLLDIYSSAMSRERNVRPLEDEKV